MKAILVVTLALALGSPAYAADLARRPQAHPSAHWTGGNCPLGNPICAPVSPGGSTPSGGNPQTDFVGALLAQKADVLKQLQAVDAMFRQINPATGQMWDVNGHTCIAGIGTEGQPGYVAGLAKWIEELNAPPSPPAVPGAVTGPIVDFARAELAFIATQNIVTSLQTQGVPQNLVTSCSAQVMALNNRILNAAGQLAAFSKLFAVLVPK